MRISIEIDDRLMREAMRFSGKCTKRETVEEGLRLLIQVKGQIRIRRLRRKVHFSRDLEEARCD